MHLAREAAFARQSRILSNPQMRTLSAQLYLVMGQACYAGTLLLPAIRDVLLVDVSSVSHLVLRGDSIT
jgi:hypothetical protein